MSAFALGRNRRVGFEVIVTEIAEMPESIPNVNPPRCRCPRLDKTTYWGEVHQTPPSPTPIPLPITTSCSHGPPDIHLAIPWDFVAFIRSAQKHRTSIYRLRLPLIFSRAASGLGDSRRLKVESRSGLSANFPRRIFLFDHVEQVEGRTPSEESRCNLSSGHRWKSAGQLGHRLADCKGQVYCLSR